MKIRMDFVSNSSSCSSVCIEKNDWKKVNLAYAIAKLQKASGFGLKMEIPSREIGNLSFEWELTKYHALGDKLNVCAIQLKYMHGAYEKYQEDPAKIEEWYRPHELEMLKKFPEYEVMLIKLCRDKLNLDVSIHYPNKFDDDDFYGSGDIDHESCFPSNMEMFESEENLEAFLLNENSYWMNANDNSDYEYDEETDQKIWKEKFEEIWETDR